MYKVECLRNLFFVFFKCMIHDPCVCARVCPCVYIYICMCILFISCVCGMHALSIMSLSSVFFSILFSFPHIVSKKQQRNSWSLQKNKTLLLHSNKKEKQEEGKMRHLRLEEKIEEKELEKNKERKKSPGLRLPVARPLSGSQLDQGTSRPPS